MMSTKSIAVSVCPNQSSASGTQQTLGNVCKREHTKGIFAKLEPGRQQPDCRPQCR